MKILLKVILVVVLLGLFWVVYQSIKLTTPNKTEVPTTQSTATTVGQEGGFHFLQGWQVQEKNDSYRIEITTSMNRSSVVEGIETPLTDVRLEGKTIRITLHDTAPDELGRLESQTFDNGVIEKISISDLHNLEEQVLVVSLRESRDNQGFKLSVSPENPGNLYLDVLK